MQHKASSLSFIENIENFLYEMYLSLMEAGHTMCEIDNMDIAFYMKMLDYKKKKEEKKKLQNLDNAGL